MQDITFYVNGATPLGVVRDYANARSLVAPTLMKAVEARLHLRLFADGDGMTPYPISAFSSVVSWEWSMAQDFDAATARLLVSDAGQITVDTVTDTIGDVEYTYTEFSIPISDMNTEELVAWLGNAESKSGLHGELVGVDSNGDDVFVLQVLDFTMRGRLGNTGSPTVIEPEYLNADQVRALVAAGFVMQFSVDGESWHDTQAVTDRYMRWRSATSASATWSPPFSVVFGTDGESSYLYIGYAEDSSGTGFSLTPALTRPYVAYVVSDTAISSPTLADFTALGAVWIRFIGQDGTNGLNGSSLTPQNILAVSNDTIEANKVYALDMSANTTLSASGGTPGYMNVSYLYVNPGTYTLTGGTNLEIATALDASKINYCEIIFSGTAAKLFVVASWDGNAEDLLL